MYGNVLPTIVQCAVEIDHGSGFGVPFNDLGASKQPSGCWNTRYKLSRIVNPMMGLLSWKTHTPYVIIDWDYVLITAGDDVSFDYQAVCAYMLFDIIYWYLSMP